MIMTRTHAVAMVLGVCSTGAIAANETEVTIQSAGVALGGTLVIPEGPGPHPAVLIVPASGPHPRDEARTGGRHWAELSDRLAAAGVASLRLDARSLGSASSTEGDPDDYPWTPRELASDSNAAFDVLLNSPGIDRGRAGLLGFSDGVSRAAILGAERAGEVGFCVLLSASGVAPAEDVVAQQVHQARQMGVDEAGLELVAERGHAAMALLLDGAPKPESIAAVVALLEAIGLPEAQREPMATRVAENFSGRGVRALLGHDPAPDLDRIECPTLIVNGGADSRLVSPRSRGVLLEAFEAETSTKLRVVTLGGLGHFLEQPDEEMEEPVFAPEVSEIIISWLTDQGITSDDAP